MMDNSFCEKIFGTTSMEINKMMESDEEQFKEWAQEHILSQFRMKIVAKPQEYNGQWKTQYRVIKLNKVTLATDYNTKVMMKDIERRMADIEVDS